MHSAKDAVIQRKQLQKRTGKHFGDVGLDAATSGQNMQLRHQCAITLLHTCSTLYSGMRVNGAEGSCPKVEVAN